MIIGKLTTALRVWLAINQQQEAIAQSTPDRNPETHTNIAHLKAMFFSQKIHTLDIAGMLKYTIQCIPLNTVG